MKSVEKLSIRAKELVRLLNQYNYEYYVLDAPTVSDDVWDMFYSELRELENTTGIVLPDSPTKNVGGGERAIKSGFKKHSHLFSLYSLDKSQSVEEVEKWFTDIKTKFPQATFTASYKFDGLSLVLTYEDGFLKNAATRGNGKIGEDVTAQVKTIKSVSHSISIKDKVVIGGEGIMRLSELKNFPELKNTRNAVAGAIRNLDPAVTKQRNLDFFAYSLNFVDGNKALSQTEVYKALCDFQVVLPKKYSEIKNFEEVKKIIKNISEERANLDFDTDGIVFNVNEPSVRENLGYTIKFPRWAMAYKFETEIVETKLLDVIWQVGRSGKVTPIAVLDAVELCGATVTRATLNNYDDIIRKGVKIGADVRIRRSNDVIPEILGSVITGNSDIKDIDLCPSCNTLLEKNGVNKFCKNPMCSARNTEKFVHFVSRDCMNIEGLSDKTITALSEKGLIKKFGDIYSLTEKDLVTLEGFKDKKIKNLLVSIEKSRQVGFANFINALGIANIGKKASGTLATYFSTLEELLLADAEQLVNIDEFGEIMATSVVNYFAENKAEVYDLVKSVNIEYKTKNEGILSGKKICITGTINNYTRLQLGKMIEELGGTVVESVSKTTDVLVAGDNCGSKLDKARKLGIKIVEQNHLSEFLSNGRL